MKIGIHRDKSLVVNILSKSFDSNQSINYIVKNDKRRTDRIEYLMEYCFEICLMKGKIFLSDDSKACALLLFPEKKTALFKNLILDISLAINVVGISRIGKILRREKRIKENQPIGKFFYLWFIGVLPEEQGKGIGGKLLHEIIQYYQKERRQFYLETSNLQNLPWYRGFGFDIVNEIDIGYKLYQLVRQ